MEDIETKRKKQGDSIKLPQELQESLRQFIAQYMARGEKPPTRGDLLLTAWRSWLAKEGAKPVAVPDSAGAEPKVPQRLRRTLGKIVEILNSGDAAKVNALAAVTDAVYAKDEEKSDAHKARR